MLSDHACDCGCGKLTSIAKRTYANRNVRAGEPYRYVVGHRGPTYDISPDGCWISRRVNSSGYGNHRVRYEFTVGPVPDGMVLDHLCRTRACVNPDHLEPTTQSENLYRVLAGRCGKGHDLDEANSWLTPQGHRRCRACNAEKSRRRRERDRMSAA